MTRPLPSNYEISRIGNRVTVNLDGGVSNVAVVGGSGDGRIYAVDPTEEFKEQVRNSLSHADPLPTRRLSGRVLDLAGKPLPGAVVLADLSFSLHGGERIAEGADGARADSAGRFSVVIPADRGISVVAMAGSGWSDVARVAAGVADAEIELAIATRTRLRGKVLLQGSGHPATVTVAGQAAGYTVNTAVDGTFEVDPITPGAYVVAAAAEDGRQAQSAQGSTA